MTVALVGIVRDEAERLPRLFASVAGLVDLAIICDTGSTDRTVTVAEALMAEFDLSGCVHRRPWVDFGTNRTEALNAARGRADWLLELDADQTITWHPDLPTWLHEGQHPDAYTIEETEAGTSWRRPRLLRGDRDWQYIGPTHEHLDTEGRTVRDLFAESIAITHHADGGHRAEKHQRDIELLAAAVAAGEPRAIYYTAQAHKCLGELDTARSLFAARASMGGWEEEAWHAEYQAALCTLELDGEPGVRELLEAHRRRPARAEPLAAIEAWCCQRRPKSTPGDALFIERTAYA